MTLSESVSGIAFCSQIIARTSVVTGHPGWRCIVSQFPSKRLFSRKSHPVVTFRYKYVSFLAHMSLSGMVFSMSHAPSDSNVLKPSQIGGSYWIQAHLGHDISRALVRGLQEPNEARIARSGRSSTARSNPRNATLRLGLPFYVHQRVSNLQVGFSRFPIKTIISMHCQWRLCQAFS